MKDLEQLKDRLLIKELVDRVSILGDRKYFNAQVQLFSEDALSETFAGGTSILKLRCRKEMAAAFGNFLKDYETVYHFNGQHIISIDGDKASGTCYCTITLIGTENSKRIKTTIGAVYQDDYVRDGNRWLIAERTGTFNWQDKSEVYQ